VILLALESATDAVGAALLRDGSGGAERTRLGGRAHAETLVPIVEEVCALEGCLVNEVDIVSVDVGPGLFTGLRVGVATAKALAQALGIGVLGVGSLDVLAAAALERCRGGAGQGGTAPCAIAAVVDARRGEVFAAVYHFERAAPGTADPAAVREDRPEPLSPLALEAWLADTLVDTAARASRASRAARATTAATAATVGPEDRQRRMVVVGLAAELAAPPPLAQARLAHLRLAAGVAPCAPADLVPDYRRAADARINWVQRIPQVRGAGT
jgi:tRNA threonylcarbamoyl adenosine modification protein YeaZ